MLKNTTRLSTMVRNEAVMVISIAYRIGLWGFLPIENPETGEISGNWGLMDVHAALEWAQEYAPQLGLFFSIY